MNEKLMMNKNRAEMPTFGNSIQLLCNIDEMEDDDNEGEKILTIEDFRKRAMEKLEVYQLIYHINKDQKVIGNQQKQKEQP
jgi:hypothetical protein